MHKCVSIYSRKTTLSRFQNPVFKSPKWLFIPSCMLIPCAFFIMSSYLPLLWICVEIYPLKEEVVIFSALGRSVGVALLWAKHSVAFIRRLPTCAIFRIMKSSLTKKIFCFEVCQNTSCYVFELLSHWNNRALKFPFICFHFEFPCFIAVCNALKNIMR